MSKSFLKVIAAFFWKTILVIVMLNQRKNTIAVGFHGHRLRGVLWVHLLLLLAITLIKEDKENLDLVNVVAADEPLEHIVLKTKSSEVHEVCCSANVAAPSSMINVDDSALRRFSDLIAGEVLSI